MTNKTCAMCGASFGCGNNSQQPCWCSQYPAIMPIENGQDCRCPECLKTIIRAKINDYVQNNPVKMAIPTQYKNKELIQDIDYYIENGNYVFTEWYHRKRGYCCGNACRHCPYDHENVR